MSSITLSLSLRGRLLSGTQTTLQGTLFGNGEPGFTFEPWDITTLYQDRAGTTPVTAAGQSVGLRLDKSKGLALGAELVTNGDFSAGTTGWTANTATLSDNSGRLQIVSTGVNQGTSQIVPTSIGKWYSLSVTIISANANYNIGYGTGFGFGDVYDSGQLSGARTLTAKIFGTGTSQTFWFFCQAAGTYIIDNISVRELAGNHEVAVNDAKRGVYGWMPKTGRRNLLTYTEDFSAAVWSKEVATVTPDVATAPNGTMTADRAVITNRILWFDNTGITGQKTQSIYAKADASGTITISAIGAQTVAGGNSVTVNLTTGAVTTGQTSSVAVTSAANGWWRISITTSVAVASGNTTYWQIQANTGVLIWGAQLETGSTATAYQRVNSQYDVTEAGVPTCYYVQADGVDDAYVTPTITPNTDKAQVFAGVRKLSDAIGIIIGHGADTNGGSGRFEVLSSGWNIQASRYGAAINLTGLSRADSLANFSPPKNNVLTWQFDGNGATVADEIKLRVDGVAQTLIVTDPAQGAGNFAANANYIYGRGGTSLPFNGLDFGHAVRFGPNLDAVTIARVEALIARNTPEVTL